MRRSIVLAALALAAVGCSARLPEGVFGCMDSLQCPAGWSCWSNMTCHSLPERDAGPGGPDMGGPPIDGGGGGRNPVCTPPCSGSMCAIGQFPPAMGPTVACISNPAPTGHGNACTSGTQCTSPDACVPMTGGHCMRPCDPANYDNGGCGFGEDCVTYAGAPICLRPCTGTGAGPCPMPLTCSSGHCVPM